MNENIFYLAWEADCMNFIQHLGDGTIFGTLLNLLNNLFSFMGEEYICIAVMGILYWGFSKEKGRRVGLIVMSSISANCLIKNIARRARPYKVLDSIELLRDVDGYSFPSCHSANAVTLYGSTAFEYKDKKWLKYVAIILPILVAFSRIRMGAHWPTDVIVGLLQGALVLLVAELLIPRLKNKYIGYLIILAISFIGVFYCDSTDFYTNLGMIIGFILGVAFEEKFVNFENTNKLSIAIIRTIVGALIYVVLNTVIKMMIGGIFADGTAGSLAIRVIRYAIILFLLIGVYPLSFKLFKKKA